MYPTREILRFGRVWSQREDNEVPRKCHVYSCVFVFVWVVFYVLWLFYVQYVHFKPKHWRSAWLELSVTICAVFDYHCTSRMFPWEIVKFRENIDYLMVYFCDWEPQRTSLQKAAVMFVRFHCPRVRLLLLKRGYWLFSGQPRSRNSFKEFCQWRIMIWKLF